MSARAELGKLAMVAVGGALGTLARVGLDQLIPENNWALSTLIVNLLGTIALAALSTYAAHRPLHSLLQLAAGTGFCGAFTTLSTMLLLFTTMATAGYLGYLLLSVTLCLLAVFATHQVIFRSLSPVKAP